MPEEEVGTIAGGDHIAAGEIANSIVAQGRSALAVSAQGPVTINQTLVQQYPALKDAVYDFQPLIASLTADFVGREAIFQRIQVFADSNPCGYIRVEAEAGLGKSALAAAIARRYDAIPFFASASEGLTRPDQCLKHLSANLIVRYGLAHDHIPDRAGEDSAFLRQILEEVAAHTHDPFWLVIDALDEADGSAPRSNPLLLPDRLPNGAYIVVTQRPSRQSLVTAPATPILELPINADDPAQQADIGQYLHRQASGRGEIKRALAAAVPPIPVAQFVSTLQAASQGNFMYLAYVLADIAGQAPGYDPLDLTKLPQGLRGYYDQFWTKMQAIRQAEGWHEWDALYRPALGLLAAAAERVSVPWLADHTRRSAVEIRERVLDLWLRFLSQDRRGGQETWHIVHHSFADFLADKLDLQAVHRQIAAYYQADPARWSAHGGYAQRHLSGHLRQAGDQEGLFALVNDRAWYEAQRASDVSETIYLNDVTQAWLLAEEATARDIAAGRSAPLVSREVHAALIRASIRNLSGITPPPLLAALVQVGVWTLAQALARIPHYPESWPKSQALKVLFPHLSQELRREALALANTIAELNVRWRVLVSFLAHIPEEERESYHVAALDTISAITDATEQIEALAEVAPFLEGPALDEALGMVREITFPDRAPALLVALIPYLPKESRLPMLGAAKRLARQTSYSNIPAPMTLTARPHPATAHWEEMLRAAVYAVCVVPATQGFSVPSPQLAPQGNDEARALAALAPHLSASLLAEALERVRAIADVGACTRLMIALRPHLSAEAQQPVLLEALAAAYAIRDARDRIWMLTRLLPDLPAEFHIEALQAALTTARTIPAFDERATELGIIASCLSTEAQRALLTQEEALAAVQAILHGSYQADALAILRAYVPQADEARVLSGVLSAEQRINDAHDQVAAAAQLIPYVPDGERSALRQAILELARTITDWRRVEALAAVVSHLPESERIVALSEFMASLRWINSAVFDTVLLPVIPHVPSKAGLPILRQMRAALRALADPARRANALAELIPYLPRQERLAVQYQALAAVESIESYLYGEGVSMSVGPGQPTVIKKEAYPFGDGQRCVALEKLAPELPSALLRKALKIARAIQPANLRAQALSTVGVYLLKSEQASVFQEALAGARASEQPEWANQALAHIIGCLARAGYLQEALDHARRLESPYWRARALLNIVPQLSDSTREAVVREALVNGWGTEDSLQRTEVLTMLAPDLPTEERTRVAYEVLGVVRALPTRDARAGMLLPLVPFLPEKEREPVLRELLAVSWNLIAVGARNQWLLHLAPSLAQLPAASLYPLWRETLHRLADLPRRELLLDIGALAPVIAKLGSAQAAQQVADSILTVGQWWP